MSITVKTHEVIAVRIEQVLPLRGNNGNPASPDAGVSLILADNTRQRWLIEEGSLPVVGSLLVYDADLHTRYLVTAEKFAELFTATAD